MKTLTAGLAGLVAILTGLSAPALAQGEGFYDVAGTDARTGKSYGGRISIASTGPETWRLTWIFGGSQHEGYGIGDGKTLSVLFHTGEGHGLVVYTWNGTDAYEGRWGFPHQTTISSERLTKR